MKLKLEILDTYINLHINFQNCPSSFGGTNNLVNPITMLESQFSSAMVSISKIHINLKTHSENIGLNSRYSCCPELSCVSYVKD